MNKILLYILILIPAYLFAHEQQKFLFKNYTTENTKLVKGLSQNSIRCVLQDSKGFLWIGTWDGLNRYDGYDFVYFYEEDGLANPTVNTLYEDVEGDLWIGTEAGLNLYDRDNDKVILFNTTNTEGLVDNHITKIIGDSEGNIWIGTQKGLSLYNPSSKRFIPFLNGPKDGTWLRSNIINDLLVDEHSLWIATPDGIIRFNKKTKSIKRLYLSAILESPFENTSVNTILRHDVKTLLLGTNHGVVSLNSDTHVFEHKNYENDVLNYSRIQDLHEDLHNDLWIGTDGQGLFIVDTTDHVHNYRYDTRVESCVGSNKVNCIYEDGNENIWIGTFNGLSLPHFGVVPFDKMTHSNSEANSLSSDFVLSVIEDYDRNLWIATDNGLNKYDRKSGRYTHILHNVDEVDGLIGNDLRYLFLDSENKLWISSNTNGVSVYDLEKNTFRNIYYDPRHRLSLSDNKCHAIVEDKNGCIWISTANGLNKYDPVSDSIMYYYHEPNVKGTISNNWIWNLFIDKDGVLWVASKGGVDRYDSDTDLFTNVPLLSNEKSCIDVKEAFVVFQDSEGIFWIGLRGGGMRMYNAQSQEVKCYTVQQGLPNNLIYSILEDNNKDLWISTNLGLAHFIRKTGGFINYDVKDGILSNEFNLWSAYKDPDGLMYFGGMNGLNIFDPRNITYKTVRSETIVTGFYLKGEVFDRDLNNGDTINLDYTDNFFSFQFASVDFSSPLKRKYRYKIDKIDKDWVVVGAEARTVDYRDVNPGTYVFQVESSNSGGSWDLEPVKITVIIDPPWYGTWWFRIAVIGFVIALGWHLINMRIRQVKKTHEIENKMLKFEMALTEARQQALRLQMNPHFIFNSLNSIQSFILKNNIDVAINYLAKFSQLMRSNLANAREAFISVEDEVKSLKYYLEIEKLRFEDKFDYTFEVDEVIDADFVGIPPMLIQPFIENAILHGIINKNEKGEIHIYLKQENEDTLLCIIEDNGIGREEANKIRVKSGFKRKSRALGITKERLQLLNKEGEGTYSLRIIDLFNDRNEASGTRIELRVAFTEL